MQKKHLCLLAIVMIFCFVFCSCSSTEYEKYGNVKATFELEGGMYKSSSRPIVYNYKLEADKMKIKDPQELMRGNYKIENPGYELVGWYRNKTESGEYTGKWDFDTDTIDSSGITLFAKWQEKRVYSFDIYYFDDDGNEQLLFNEVVNEGGQLSAELEALDRDGYTFIKYLNEDKTIWDLEYKHPGGAHTEPIKVYALYEKGNFKVVRTKAELKSAIRFPKNNIYIDADIDMEGEKLYFNDYKGILKGNNHKIYNFALNPEPKGNLKDSLENKVLYVSLFGNIENATIENISFESATLVLQAGLSMIDQIYLLPLSINMTNSTIQNVSFEGTYQVTEWPTSSTFEKSDDFIVSNNAYFEKDDLSVISSNVINFNEKGE